MISLNNKKELLHIDNFDPLLAKDYSNIYKGILFFTTDGHIWKDGIEYTNKHKVCSNNDCIDFIDSFNNKIYNGKYVYELQILNESGDIGFIKKNNDYYKIENI
jgi:hypothetical protein